MYISKEQLASRLQGQSNLELRGRNGVGKRPELDHETKVLIGVLAKTDTQSNVAKAFDTSQANVSNISNNPELKDEVNAITKETHEKVTSKAVDILISSLGVVGDKVKKEGALSASTIAKNMATIVDKFTPRRSAETGFAPKILINIHGSKQKDESAYDSIEVEAVNQ